MERDPSRHPNRRLVGAAGWLAILRDVGLLGPFAARSSMLHFVADDGQPVPVVTLGIGRPIVLLHGLGCSHRHWMPVARRLARRGQVFVWDARCHGRSVARPGCAISLQRLAADLQQMLDHFQLDRVVLVGHSMGALTGLQYVCDFGSARVQALALVDQSPRVVTDDLWRLGLFGGCSRDTLLAMIAGARHDLADVVAREVEAATGGWLRHSPRARTALTSLLRRWLGKFDAGPLLDLSESLVQADFRALLPRLDIPLWVVLGGRSAHYGGVPLEAYYRASVPHATVTVYERSGHSPHVAEPGRFAGELQEFLAGHA